MDDYIIKCLYIYKKKFKAKNSQHRKLPIEIFKPQSLIFSSNFHFKFYIAIRPNYLIQKDYKIVIANIQL